MSADSSTCAKIESVVSIWASDRKEGIAVCTFKWPKGEMG